MAVSANEGGSAGETGRRWHRPAVGGRSRAEGLQTRLMDFNDFQGNLESRPLSLPWPDSANPVQVRRLAARGQPATRSFSSRISFENLS